MTIHSHPSEATLLAYAAGTLWPGASLAVAAHLDFCEACRQALATWETAAGAMLDSLPESGLMNDAMERTLARALSNEATPPREPVRPAPPDAFGVTLPASVVAAGVKPRRWLGTGTWKATIQAEKQGKSQTYLLRLAEGHKIPRHGHGGAEMICVLKGSFTDASGQYWAGDFVEADEHVDHEPVATGGECICIIASETPPRFRGVLGWFLRPFTG